MRPAQSSQVRAGVVTVSPRCSVTCSSGRSTRRPRTPARCGRVEVCRIDTEVGRGGFAHSIQAGRGSSQTFAPDTSVSTASGPEASRAICAAAPAGSNLRPMRTPRVGATSAAERTWSDVRPPPPFAETTKAEEPGDAAGTGPRGVMTALSDRTAAVDGTQARVVDVARGRSSRGTRPANGETSGSFTAETARQLPARGRRGGAGATPAGRSGRSRSTAAAGSAALRRAGRARRSARRGSPRGSPGPSRRTRRRPC